MAATVRERREIVTALPSLEETTMPRKTYTNGNDWLDGTLGDDLLTGGRGNDTFVYRAGSGDDTITDFTLGDRIMLDSRTGVYDGQVGGHLGYFRDGFEIINSHGTLVATMIAGDYNDDGITDTRLQLSDGSITILGWSPDQISSSMLYGG
jgi:Ca2+-binding RTX toxin-like protein